MSTSPDDSLRRALGALTEMRTRLEALERARNEPIAIVGIGCRFPGDADDPASFWRLLLEGRDAVGEVPAHRCFADAITDGADAAITLGGWLRRVDAFDADFFGISPREAAAMDPQQRLLLEVAWEALEDAGQPAATLGGSEAGVFVGVHSHSSDYWAFQSNDPAMLDMHAGTGTSHSVLAGRLSYILDLRGPSLVLDTACSSSLVAAHSAVQSLRAGECSMALAAGVNLILSPVFTIAASRMQMLAADGRCKTFDARADGFVRGEGCGVVVLKRLSDALAAGDRIHAVIRGSAVNQDGRTNGLTAPNGPSQAALIRKALAGAGVSPQQIGYIEAHGTGTPLGDPIELEALVEALGQEGAACRVGAVKSNFGHLEGAAGIAGLIKAALVLEHGVIPPNVHFERLNPHIDLSRTRLAIPTESTDWSSDGPRYAGVSSFGWSGTNAHVVLESPPDPVVPPAAERDVTIVPFSARSPEALAALAPAWHASLSESSAPLADVAYCAAVRRDHHPHRRAIICRSREALLDALDGMAAGTAADPSVGARKVAFVFPGQGGQWPGMARGLIAAEPVFREALEKCDAALRPELGRSVFDVLTSPVDDVAAIDTVQPTLFAVQVALTALWQSWGIGPDVVVGHSMGEVAAAYVAGALTLEDAGRVICRRSVLLKRLRGRGGMAVVNLPAAELRERIAEAGAALEIAAMNAPRSTVVAGEAAALDTLLGTLVASDVFCRRIEVDVASHSAHVDEIEAELLSALAPVSAHAADLPILSTVTGGRVDGASLDASYWTRNLRQPVRFAEATAALAAEGVTAFVEIGPHPILLPAIEATLEASGATALLLPSMRRGENERAVLYESLADLYRGGRTVVWEALYPNGLLLRMPGYPWQRRRHWLARTRRRPAATSADRSAAAGPSVDGGASVPSWFHRIEWRPFMPGARAGPRRWLIVPDGGELADALARELIRRGEDAVVKPYPESTIDRASAGTTLDTGTGSTSTVTAAPWARMLSAAADERPFDGVVDLRALRCEASFNEAGPMPALARTCGDVLALVQALTSGQTVDRAKLYVVTRGAQAVGHEAASPVQAALWGFGASAAAERPASWGGLIDLDARDGVDETERIADALLRGGAEDRIAVRGGRLLVSRLVPVEAAATHASPPASAAVFRSDRSYLITGGLGGIGVRLARWLASRGARHLILVGRHANERAAAMRLSIPGVEVDVVDADVTRRNDIDALFARIVAQMPPLAGVFHAAGILDDGIIARQSWDRFARILAPKAEGAWHLHEATRGLDLDVFVLFSSAAAVVGTPAQGGYAAANAFLDALAHSRRAEQLPALSVAWGRWAEVGLAATTEREHNLERLGFDAMAPDAALDALGRALGDDAAHVAIMAFDPLRYAAAHQGGTPAMLHSLVAAPVPSPAPETSPLRAKLDASDDTARVALLRTVIRAEVATVLHIDDPAALDETRGFFTIGMNSLMAVELRNRLESVLNEAVPSTIAFDHPSIERLVEYLGTRLAAPQASTAAPARTDTSLDGLSIDELDALLEVELHQLHEGGDS